MSENFKEITLEMANQAKSLKKEAEQGYKNAQVQGQLLRGNWKEICAKQSRLAEFRSGLNLATAGSSFQGMSQKGLSV